MSALSNLSVVSEQHDLRAIDFVAGLSDPGEMIRCGYRPELRRHAGEQDAAYLVRIRPLVLALPKEERDIILGAAIRRAGLDNATGKVALVVAGDPAWMRLGVNVNRAMTAEELFAMAPQLDIKVSKKQLQLEGKDFPGAFGISRDDTGDHFAVVGANYKVFQNRDCVALLNALTQANLAMFHTAGCLKGGRTFFAAIKIPGEYRISGTEDVMEPWTILTNSHDGTSALKLLPSAFRPVCQNTLNMAVKSAKKSSVFSVRHSTNMEAKVEDMRLKLGLVVKGMDGFMEKANVMAKYSMTGGKADQFFKSMFPTDVKVLLSKSEEFVSDELKAQKEREAARNQKVVDELQGLFVNGRNTLKGMAGSAWAAVNAVTEYVDHNKKGRGKDDAARLDQQAFNSLLGTGADLKSNAFNMAFNLTQAV